MGISDDEAAARHTAGLFASASGSFSSHRLMEGSLAAMGAAPQEQGGVNNEPNFTSVGRSDLLVRAEDFVGLYASVGRLSRDIEGGPNIAHSAIINVGAVPRSVPRPAMLSFAGGDFRVQPMGRGRLEEGISSLQPLLGAPGRGGAHEAEDEGPVPWHHSDPSSSAREMLRADRADKSAEAQGMALEAQTMKETSGIGTQSAEHQRVQQPLALARIEADRGGSIAEQLDQAHQHRLYEQQQRELMLRQRSLAGSMACHDCGNQAKKDCPHMRCRTCCKSRGFECSTHVRSTWVPVSKRRQRLQQAGLLHMGGSGGGELHYHENMKISKLKRARTLSLGAGSGAPNFAADQAAPSHTSTSTAGTPPRSSDINSAAAPPPLSQEGQVRGAFPPEVRMQAVLRCVKLTGIVDGQEEYAYQTEVRIGGHTFKGILHDQGVDKSEFGASSLAELQLGGRNVQSSTALMDLPSIYGSGGNTILGAFR